MGRNADARHDPQDRSGLGNRTRAGAGIFVVAMGFYVSLSL